MEVSVVAPSLKFSSFCVFPSGSAVSDVLERFVPQQDFYVTRNGRLSPPDQLLHHGAVYHLEPRLCGGKGGFGSMLRALGAQIEKTTNREACRDLSGRRLRDVNHEKEMAEWLKKQAEREAEKEQRRVERLQRKLATPKHQFSDPEYQRQCHHLSERLEDSVLKGLQASSSGQVTPRDGSAKRPASGRSEEPQKRRKDEGGGVAMGGFWTGLDDVPSSEDEEPSPPTTPGSCGAAATVTTQGEKAGLGSSSSDCSSSSPGPPISTPEDQDPPEPPPDPPVSSLQDQDPPEPPADPPVSSLQDQDPPEPPADPPVSSLQDQDPPQSSAPTQQVDLASLTSARQLELLGLEVLKRELQSRGLKCGGTLAERAARLFSVRGRAADQVDPALLAKPARTRKK